MRLPLFSAVKMARALPPRSNRHRMAKKRGAGRKYSRLCAVQGCGARLRAFNLLIFDMKSFVGCRMWRLFLFFCAALHKHAWNFLNALLGSTIAFTASSCLYPRPLRACSEPQAGVSPPRQSPLLCISPSRSWHQFSRCT